MTRRRLIGQGNIFDCTIFAVVTRHAFIRNITKWLFPPAHILWPLGYAFQNTSKPRQLPQWHKTVPEQCYHAATVKVHLGRTPQLHTGLSDPPQQSATAMVKSIQCSHRSLVCNQPDMNRRWGWFCRACPAAPRSTSQQPEHWGGIQTQPFSKWSSDDAERSRNARPEVEDWIIQQHHAPTAWWPVAGHRQVTANHAESWTASHQK